VGQFPGGAPSANIKQPQPVAAESFHAVKERDHLRSDASATMPPDLNLPHWNGAGVPLGMPKVRARDE